jgi:glycosyltransferase involved in cell wall biosynthesis
MSALSYALVTPTRSERTNLERLAAALAAQTTRPTHWVIVDNGSDDGTDAVAAQLARTHDWITAMSIPGEDRPVPGAPIVRAFHAGLAALGELPDLVVKLDADVSMAPDHFALIGAAFAADRSLGIASGMCLEQDPDGQWLPVKVAKGHVRGAVRVYRRECLEQVTPLVERVGWDGLDELKATVLGWSTRTLPDLEFQHHRRLGARDGAPTARWRAQGDAAWFMGYRFSYLVLRSLNHARRDRAALSMIPAFLSAAVRRRERYADLAVRKHLRQTQRLRTLVRTMADSRRIAPSNS